MTLRPALGMRLVTFVKRMIWCSVSVPFYWFTVAFLPKSGTGLQASGFIIIPHPVLPTLLHTDVAEILQRIYTGLRS